jgi:DNA mismatch repair protein MutS
MQQYWEQKQQAPDAILLFRMGDFYEMFYDDAELGAKVLGITLTSRDSGKTPLAGIPHHALEGYLAKLVAAGHKVAISEQIEDARQAQGVVKRAIVRIVTPGTLTDDGLLDRTRSNVLAALCPQGNELGLAALELSTGHFVVQTCPAPDVLNELARLQPAEVLLAEPTTPGGDPLAAQIREDLGTPVTQRSPADFSPQRAAQLLREHFETAGVGVGLERIDLSLQAAAALLSYVRETQKTLALHIQPPRRRVPDDHLALDATTLRSLEIEQTLRTQARAGSLLAAVDHTCNPMGARLLRTWLCYPLKDPDRIRARQRSSPPAATTPTPAGCCARPWPTWATWAASSAGWACNAAPRVTCAAWPMRSSAWRRSARRCAGCTPRKRTPWPSASTGWTIWPPTSTPP